MLAKRAVLGALWTISTSIGSRVVGLVGTILVARKLGPEICGETSLASIVVLTAFVFSSFGLGQYVVSKPNEGREASFHATFYFLLLGAIAIAGAVLLREPIGDLLHSPGIVAYVPGLAIAAMFERVATVQDRILVRDMRFRAAGLLRSFGEIVYAVVSVVLAFKGWEGASIVWGSIARSALRLVAITAVTPLREWLEPCRITWRRTRDMFAFGLPMSVASLAGWGSRRWDNAIIGRHFGGGTLGHYNYAYNLADIPATQIGETIGDVLVPSFAEMESDERRKKALLLSMRLLMLIVAPLAVGLGVIAPTLVDTFFDERWLPVANMLIMLSVLSVVRPVGWIGSSYLQVRNKTRAIMILEVAQTVGLLALMVVFENLWRIATFMGLPGLNETLGLRHYSSLYACGAVGVAFALSSLGFIWVIKRVDGISLRAQILPLLPPVVACAPMVVAVLAIRHGLALYASTLPRALLLTVETLVGALVFVPSALVLSPSTSRELWNLLKNALLRRRAKAAPEQQVAPPSSSTP